MYQFIGTEEEIRSLMERHWIGWFREPPGE